MLNDLRSLTEECDTPVVPAYSRLTGKPVYDPVTGKPAVCCIPPTVCKVCIEEHATIEWDITFADITALAGCILSTPDCGLNRTFRATARSQTFGFTNPDTGITTLTTCGWSYEVTAELSCTPDGVDFFILDEGGNWVLYVQAVWLFLGADYFIAYRKVLGPSSSLLDCSTIIDVDVPVFYNPGLAAGNSCDGAFSTCRVTAILVP